ncbi:MAG: hypothetical protein JNL67_07510 [Planctomycetaceae bacterium]|nr:hypothetical protein [Planctomycetaceae bacterium]
MIQRHHMSDSDTNNEIRKPISTSKANRLRQARINANGKPQKSPRPVHTATTIQPTGLIYLGGTGAMIGSQVDKLLTQQKSDAFYRSLVIETEDASQSGATNGQPFAENSFLHAEPRRVKTVLDFPERHQMMCSHVGLDDADSLHFHRSLINDDLQHAGQVRSFGYLASATTFVAIRGALKSLIAELQGAMATLHAQLDRERQIKFRNRLCFHIVFSASGGTGSSMALLVASLIRELTKETPCEITAYVLLPSAFDGVLGNKPEQLHRIRANCYGTIAELEAARLGLYVRENTRLGISPDSSVSIPANVFNEVFVAGRKQANGKDLGSLEAVHSTVAMHLAGVIGTEIADRIVADEQNEKSLKRLVPDPLTKLPRHVGSIGGQALALDIDRMAEHCATRQVRALLELALGTESSKEVTTKVQAYLAKPLATTSMTVRTDSIINLLLKSVAVPAETINRNVFRAVAGSSRLHYRNRKFVPRVRDAQQHFMQTQLPAAEAKLNEIVATLSQQLQSSLVQTVNAIGEALGFVAMLQFCQDLSKHLESMLTGLPASAESELARSKAQAQKLAEMMVALSGWWSGLFTSKSKQIQVANLLTTTISAATNHQVHLATHRLLTLLLSQVTGLKQSAEQLVNATRSYHTKARESGLQTRAGQRLTTDYLSELDLSTVELDKRFYAQNHLASDAFQGLVAESLEVAPGKAMRVLVADKKNYETALELAREHFRDRAGELSVVDVLAELLLDPQTESNTMTRLRHLLENLQPLWSAESGQVGVEYCDQVLIGLPAANVPHNREIVVNAIRNIGSRRIHADGQYNGEIQIVTTGDLRRVYGIRRTSGASWYYLNEIREAKQCYDSWNESGRPSVHIFNAELVAKMGTLLPKAGASDGELAFAVGLAYGWIAGRGSHYYFNLQSLDKDPNTLVCPLTSQWNGLAFNQFQLNTECRSVQSVIERKKLMYECQSVPDEDLHLGRGLAESLATLLAQPEQVKTLLEAFDAVRTAAGDLCVLEDLESYVAQVKKRTRPTDADFGLIQKMLERLFHQIAELHAANR